MSQTTAKVGVTIGTKAEAAPVDRYTASVNRMRDAIKNLFASKNAATAGAAFGGSFAAAGLSVSAMVGKITEAIGGSSELASEMALVERRAGLAGEAFQVLGRAGKIASEELISSLAKYRVKLGDALGGDLDARKIFGGMGQSPEALTKLPMERQLELIGSALGRLGDRNREAAVAQEIFGRGYAAMLPLLERLRTEGYDKLRAKISETAGALDNDMSRALTKSKKEAAEAANQLSIALAPVNLRLLKMKSAITSTLADNAGTIQSAGTALAGGFLTAATLTQIANRIGPQLNVIGSQGAAAFSKGFGVGAALLPGIIAQRLSGPGAAASFAGLGRALATPFGAAFAVVLGGFLISELERIALADITRRDAILANGANEINGLRSRITTAGSTEEASKAAAEAGALLEARRKDLLELEAKQKKIASDYATLSAAAGRAGARSFSGPQDLSADELTRLQRNRQDVAALEKVVEFAKLKGEAIAKANGAQRSANDLAATEAAELEKTRAGREALMDRETQNRFAALVDDGARLELLKQWREDEERALNAKIAATKNAELATDRELEKRVKLADIDAKIAQNRERAADEAERAARAAGEEVDRMLERISREARNETMRGLDSEMHGVAVERARTQGDFRQSGAAKWIAEQKAIADSAIAARAALADLQAQKRVDAAMGMNTEDNEGQIQRVKDQLDQLEIARPSSGPDPTSWVEQTAAALAQLQDQWGTTAQQIGQTISGTIGGAVDSVADNITNALLVTGDWNAALGNVAISIGTELVRAIVAMGVRWVATRIMMAVADKFLAGAATAATKPLALAQSAIWSGPATLATIASFGGAAVQAPMSIGAAMAMTQALAAIPGFSEGGYTGEAGGIVHPKEFVFSAPAVDSMGLDNLETLHRAALNPSTPSASAGSGSSGGRDKPVRVVLVDGRNTDRVAELMADPRYHNLRQDIGSDVRASMGIPR